MKKKYIIPMLLLGLPILAMAQQEEQYTQFMFYKLGFNPGYAGSQDGATVSALVRNQWMGLDGAPQTQLVTFNMPLLNNRIGVGGSVLRQSIGVTNYYTAEGVYAYRPRVGRGTLGLGLQASVRLLRVDYGALQGTQPIDIDEAVPASLQSKYVPNFGVGAYYSTDRYYLGISAPRLLQNNIDLADVQGAIINRERQHFFFMGGLLLPVGDKVQFQPQLLLKYVKNTPFDGDVNFNFIFVEKYTAGLSYRLGGSKSNNVGEAVSLLLAAQITDNLLLGVSYDATITDLRNYNSGTVELAVRYSIGGSSKGREYINPRFF
jgi:type IX secretion system PorP/SprF family membrane protein